MVYIVEVNVKRIVKDSFRFIEENSILSKVFVCFVFVPLEFHDTILTIVEGDRISSKPISDRTFNLQNLLLLFSKK